MPDACVEAPFKVEVFAATSSGCERLARLIGLPVACVRVSDETDAAISAMNATDYGGWTLWPEGFQPFEPEAGWRDWRELPFGSDAHMPHDLHCEKGRFALDLPTHVTAKRFEAALHTEFHRFAMAEVTTTPCWLVAQSDAQRPVLIKPRYTLSADADFRAGVARVDDLYVIDPSVHVGSIARAISKAKARATRRADEDLRHV